MQLLKNLYQVSGDLMGLTWDGEDAAYRDANVYALQTPEGIVLFDCGCGDTWPQIERNLRYWGLDPGAIRCCFLTHAHIDHTGAAHLLKARGTRLVAHPLTAEAVAAGDERCGGFLYHKTFQPVTVDQHLSDGEQLTVCGLTVHARHLPGHSAGCTAYFFEHESRRIVVSGDIIGTLLAGQYGWSGSIDFDRKRYIESLQRFAREETDLMLPGHGMVYFHEPRRRVEEVLNSALMEWR